MCDYRGQHFDAPYHDAVCVDGFLWDLDSVDDGMMTSGGTDPCPKCNGRIWLAEAAEEISNTSAKHHGRADGFDLWEAVTRRHLHNYPETAKADLIALGKHTITDGDTGDTRTWPWVTESVSAHMVVTILAGGKGQTDQGIQ